MITSIASHTFAALGTSATVATADGSALDNARVAVEREVRAVDEACSRFRADSELVRLNGRAGRRTVVSPLLYEAITVALRAARLTDGKVSPTVGSAMRILGYDRSFAEVPRASQPLTVRIGAIPGWEAVALDPRTSTVLCRTGVELDLGATAKAWCADRAARAAAATSGVGVLVSLGGDIAVAGQPVPGGWPVLVTDDHAAALDSPGQTVAIASGGLATSGTSVRRWRRGGLELHHLINPATGWPAGASWRTVSVMAGSCVDANTASTAAMVMGDSAPAWLAEHRLAARLVDTDDRVVLVGGWPADDGGRQ